MGKIIKLHERLIEYGSIEGFEEHDIHKVTQNNEDEEVSVVNTGKAHASGEYTNEYANHD